MPGLFGPAGQQPYPDPVYFIVPVGQQPCLDFSGRQDSNHIRIPLFYCASRTTTMPGLFGPAGQQPYPDPVYFIVPVGQQPCLDFSGRQDSNHIRIPLFYCASRTTTMPGLFGPAGQQPYPDPVILYTCVDIYIYVSFIIIILVAMGHQS